MIDERPAGGRRVARHALKLSQWVLSLPRQVRFLLARDTDLLTQLLGVFLRKVFAWQRRRARAHGKGDPPCGAVTFVQRFGSLLNLNCHAHALLPDGVFAAGPDGAVAFHPLPPPWDDGVSDRLCANAFLRDDAAIDKTWRNLRALARRLTGRGTAARQAVAAALRYIRSRKAKMRYASHYRADLPIGSGATESTCWQMQQRVKLPGQSWDVPGLRGILAMRALVLSERWRPAWQVYAATHRKNVRVAA